MTTTPTSGAADLRTAAQAVVDRWDTPLWKDVPATAEYIGRLRAALAAGQATAAQVVVPAGWNIVPTEPTQAMLDAVVTSMDDFLLGKEAEKQYREDWAAMLAAAPAQQAAQPGAAYAALPDEGEPWRGHKFKEVQRGCWRCDCGKTIKEVTSDQSTPASGGNYPVMPKRYTVDDDGEELFTAEKMRAFADATHALRASHGQAPAETGNSVSAQTDSVQEDAARYRWLREGNDAKHGAAWHVAVNLYGCEWDAAIDAAMNKGGAT